MGNRLATELSPYLRQHADNPVDWYPWGPEALERARTEGRPVLLSIGYAACHWCHVMERESFQDPGIAAAMNRHFVSIKVDREERPDLDSVYMQAVQAMAGHGGWPMTVFLTPDLKPFFAGTYFPPQDRHGVPGFHRVLEAVAAAYRERRDEVYAAAERVAAHLRQALVSREAPGGLDARLLDQAHDGMAAQFDRVHGGFGGAPKFPQPAAVEFLLRTAHRTGQGAPLAMAVHTLDAMAGGGVYDHLGGGFHRYATDRAWRLPHFEKMLYDSALLARAYIHGYQATGRPLYRRVAEETLNSLLREMRGPAGGFFSSRDADSEGHEGRFYLWGYREAMDLLAPELGAELAPLVCQALGVEREGQVEGRSVLRAAASPEDLAAGLGLPLGIVEAALDRGKGVLSQVRRRRPPPATDDKVLAGWNGLAVAGLAEAGAVLARPDYLEAAERAASLVLGAMAEGGRLRRSYREGRAGHLGCLEDYAFMADGLVSLYEATLSPGWLAAARRLADGMLALFWEPSQDLFFDTGSDHEGLVARPREVSDGATPCGSSAAAMALLRLAALTGDHRYRGRALQAMEGVAGLLARHPLGFAHWLCGLDFALSSPLEVVIAGDVGQAGARSLLDALHGVYLPNKVVAGVQPGVEPPGAGLPLLEGKGLLGGRPAAYVCRGQVCGPPTADPGELVAQLRGGGP